MAFVEIGHNDHFSNQNTGRLHSSLDYLYDSNLTVQSYWTRKFHADWTHVSCYTLIGMFAVSLQDSRGARAVPLPGFEVSTAPLPATEKSELKHTFRLSHSQQALLFGAQDAELQAKWVEVLSRAARGEMPTDASVSLTENRKSQ